MTEILVEIVYRKLYLKTQQRFQFSEHVWMFRTSYIHTGAHSYKAGGLQHLQLTVVERVRQHDVETRRTEESFWIARIRLAINGQT